MTDSVSNLILFTAQSRLERQQKDAEVEYQRKIDYLRERPVMSQIHPIRRALYQSQSAGPRLSRR